jgi:hypothetical protein
VGWQLAAPGLEAPISVLPLPTKVGSTEAATASVKLELFVDQSICELFLHDGRGAGSAVVTFGCVDGATGSLFSHFARLCIENQLSFFINKTKLRTE